MNLTWGEYILIFLGWFGLWFIASMSYFSWRMLHEVVGWIRKEEAKTKTDKK